MQNNQERLVELLTRENALLGKILEMTQEQAGLLTEEKVDALRKSLDKRRAVMDEIDGLHQETEVLMQSYVSVTGTQEKNRNEAVEAQRARFRGILGEIIGKNEENAAKAKQTLEQYSEQSNKLSMNRKSIGLYAQSVTYSGDYYDSKS